MDWPSWKEITLHFFQAQELIALECVRCFCRDISPGLCIVS